MSTAIAKAKANTMQIAKFMEDERVTSDLAMALPKFMDVDHFKRVILTEVRRTPGLQECAPMTVLASTILAAQLGLEPGLLGHCYLIPRYNGKTKTKECNFQMGYKGLMMLAHRSGDIKDITVEAVHEHDEFHYSLGDEARVSHTPPDWSKGRGNAQGYYAIIKTTNGGTYRCVMSKTDIQEHAEEFSDSYSKSYSPWKKNFDAMAKKTVLLRVLKLAPLSVDMMRQVETDGVTKRQFSKDMKETQDDEMQEIDYSIVENEEDENPTSEKKTEKVTPKVNKTNPADEPSVNDLMNGGDEEKDDKKSTKF